MLHGSPRGKGDRTYEAASHRDALRVYHRVRCEYGDEPDFSHTDSESNAHTDADDDLHIERPHN